ncbi:MAG: Gfo/Idh/MocA family oxidoreductase [Steroidobacteraceae bacterium]
MNLRAAVIGCGWIGSEVADDPLADGVQSHAGAYAACEGATLVGVCDADALRAARAALRWGLVSGHSSIRDLVRETRPEIVSVCTPDATHAEVIGELLGCSGIRAIIAEKPLASDAESAAGLVAAAHRAGVVLAVNYSRRFAHSHVAIRERIASGELGSVQAVLGAYGKGVAHNGTHWFDLARWLVGEIETVTAWEAAGDPTRGGDPNCHVRIEFADGAQGYLTALDERHYTIFEMDVIGSRARVSLRGSGEDITWCDVLPSARYSGYLMLASPTRMVSGFRDVALHLVDDVIDALRGHRAPQCTGADGVAALAVVDAIHRSLAGGGGCEVVKRI